MIHFKPNDEPSNQLYYQANVLKFNDYVTLQNALFAYDHCHNLLPSPLKNSLIFVRNIHDHNTRNATNKHLALPLTNTECYGINSIKYQSISTWNMFLNKLHNIDTTSLSKNQYKNEIKKFIIKSYT